jgi:hypothetical protein
MLLLSGFRRGFRYRPRSGQVVTIGPKYLDANAPIVMEQLQKAGVRLAQLLDIAFAP